MPLSSAEFSVLSLRVCLMIRRMNHTVPLPPHVPSRMKSREEVVVDSLD